MNPCKTQLLPVGTWQQTSRVVLNSIKLNELDIVFCTSATNLGFTFDSSLSMHEHIKKLVTSCSFQLRQLHMIKKSLDNSSLISLIHSFVHSRLDYCNSLFYGISNREMVMIQSVQNRAAKIVTGGLKIMLDRY